MTQEQRLAKTLFEAMLAQQVENSSIDRRKFRAMNCCTIALELLITHGEKMDRVTKALADKLDTPPTDIAGMWRQVQEDIKLLASAKSTV